VLVRHRENLTPDQARRSGVNTNGKEFQVLEKLLGVLGRDAPTTNRNQQCICNLKRSMRWDDCFVTRL
jgi:hypothetical protein